MGNNNFNGEQNAIDEQLINNNNNEINPNNDNNVDKNQYNKINKNKLTLTFLLIFFINSLILIISKYTEIKDYNYTFYPEMIYRYFQYYRFITRYFIHFGFCHLFIELLITFYLCYHFENVFGTLFTITFILLSMIMISVVQFLIILLYNYIFSGYYIGDPKINYEGGATAILFCLNTYYFLFNHTELRNFNYYGIIFSNGKFSSFYIIFILYLFTPNTTFIANLCGILTAILLKNELNFFLPKISWIIKFENFFYLDGKGRIYRFIIYEDKGMRTILNQIEKKAVKYNPKEGDKNKYNIITNEPIEETSIEMHSLSNTIEH